MHNDSLVDQTRHIPYADCQFLLIEVEVNTNFIFSFDLFTPSELLMKFSDVLRVALVKLVCRS